MIKRMCVCLLAAGVLGAAAALGGCQSAPENGATGESAVQTGLKATPSGDPVPPMAEQRSNKEGN